MHSLHFHLFPVPLGTIHKGRPQNFRDFGPPPPLVRIFARSIRVNPRNLPYYVCFWDVLYVWPLTTCGPSDECQEEHGQRGRDDGEAAGAVGGEEGEGDGDAEGEQDGQVRHQEGKEAGRAPQKKNNQGITGRIHYD